MAYIEIQNCLKVINKNTILDSVSLELDKNKIYGFVGRNGSGKTMLFKILSGLVNVSGGSVLIDGKPLGTQKDYPVKLGVMIENNGLWPYLSAYDNLAVLASIRKELAKNDILKVIERVGLADTGKKAFSKFSLGMKQRLVFAQAIMEKPELLILDEPTNALDKQGIELFKEIILEEKKRGATILVASHSLADFENFCDDVIYMDAGKITEQS